MSLQDFKEYLSERSVDFLPTILQYVVEMRGRDQGRLFLPEPLTLMFTSSSSCNPPLPPPSSSLSSTVDPHAYGRYQRGDKGNDGTDPHAKLLASTSEDIRRTKSAFVKGSWNVNAVGLGGLGYNPEELAAAQLQGLNETEAATEYVPWASSLSISPKGESVAISPFLTLCSVCHAYQTRWQAAASDRPPGSRLCHAQDDVRRPLRSGGALWRQ